MNLLYEDGTVIRVFPAKGRRPDNRSLSKMTAEELCELPVKDFVRKEIAAIHAKKERSFELDSRKKRYVRCSAIRQFLTARYKILFCTLTFPGEVNHEQANKLFSKFVENLQKNYKLNSYVAIKEIHKSGNPHFHCLFDLPFTSFETLNKAWNSTFSHLFPYSRNAFTTGNSKFAENPRQVSAYIAKYISKNARTKTENLVTMTWKELFELEKYEKALDELYKTRIFFVSRNVQCKPAKIKDSSVDYLKVINRELYDYYEGDYFSMIIFKDYYCLPEDILQLQQAVEKRFSDEKKAYKERKQRLRKRKDLRLSVQADAKNLQLFS